MMAEEDGAGVADLRQQRGGIGDRELEMLGRHPVPRARFIEVPDLDQRTAPGEPSR